MCFTNLITLSGQCSDTPSLSGFTLNDININADFINSIIERDNLNADDYVSQVLSYATKAVTNEVHGKFNEKYLKKTILTGERVGLPNDNLQLVNGAANTYKGIRLDICNYTDYFQFSVSSISLQTNTTGTVNVLVYDLLTGLLLDTIPVTTVAQEMSTAYVNKVYKSNKKDLDVIFVYDSSAVNSYKTNLEANGCNGCRNKHRPNNIVEGTAITLDTGDTAIKSNLGSGTETGGMSIVYSVECDHENWLCEKKNILAYPILQKMGMVIMDKALDSERLNQSTIFREQIGERRDRFETEYNNTMKWALENMDTPKGSCFLCNHRMKLNPVGI